MLCYFVAGEAPVHRCEKHRFFFGEPLVLADDEIEDGLECSVCRKARLAEELQIALGFTTE